MSGVVVIVFIPTEKKEKEFMLKPKIKIISPKNDQFIQRSMPSRIEDEDRNEDNCIRSDESVDVSSPMIAILERILSSSCITNAVWSGKGDYVQVMFPLNSQKQCELILQNLNESGIGRSCDSSVSVLPCCIHYFGPTPDLKDPGSMTMQRSIVPSGNTWNNFISSKNTRLTVDQIVETVTNKAVLTFDFLCLLLISTTMCALGLVENSTVCLLSSMVMSPMMGPVMAATFGNVIRHTHLKKIGVRNELLGLGVATLVGFCYGSVTCILTDKYGNQEWPTYEITSRGELRSLWIGFVIALLSGAAVALGILSDNVASLVGVAISTSLMPPAVNAGLLWSMASVYYMKGNSTNTYHSLDFKRQYSDNDFIELLSLGFISICLTVVNIVCIYVSAVCIFRVKEVAPLAVISKQRRQFWKYGLKNARQNNTLPKEEGQNICNRLAGFAEEKKTPVPGDISHYFTHIPKKEMNSKMSTTTWAHSTQKIGSMRDLQFAAHTSADTENQNDCNIKKEEKNMEIPNEEPETCPKIGGNKIRRKSDSSMDSDSGVCSRKSKRRSAEKYHRSMKKEFKLIRTNCKTFLVCSCEEGVDSLNNFEVLE